MSIRRSQLNLLQISTSPKSYSSMKLLRIFFIPRYLAYMTDSEISDPSHFWVNCQDISFFLNVITFSCFKLLWTQSFQSCINTLNFERRWVEFLWIGLLLKICKTFLRYLITSMEKYKFGSTKISKTWCVVESTIFLFPCDPFLVISFSCWMPTFELIYFRIHPILMLWKY